MPFQFFALKENVLMEDSVPILMAHVYVRRVIQDYNVKSATPIGVQNLINQLLYLLTM